MQPYLMFPQNNSAPSGNTSWNITNLVTSGVTNGVELEFGFSNRDGKVAKILVLQSLWIKADLTIGVLQRGVESL